MTMSAGEGARASPRHSQGFWITNSVANPPLRLLLRSPLGRWMGKSLAIIQVTGRKSGRSYSLVVQYVREGDTAWVLPAHWERKTWWRNLRGGADMAIRLAGRDHRARGTALLGGENPAAVAEGLAAYLSGSPGVRKSLGLQPSATTAADAPEIRELSGRAVIVRVDLAR
ncbi:MAG: nitroreductase family deazaflavin-dependent oxidoreductase [Chloroflexi bacterium]|nr:nitroreductase family deazaflavin-dependent oxidoreductase [Chloroflexota bacterium]